MKETTRNKTPREKAKTLSHTFTRYCLSLRGTKGSNFLEVIDDEKIKSTLMRHGRLVTEDLKLQLVKYRLTVIFDVGDTKGKEGEKEETLQKIEGFLGRKLGLKKFKLPNLSLSIDDKFDKIPTKGYKGAKRFDFSSLDELVDFISLFKDKTIFSIDGRSLKLSCLKGEDVTVMPLSVKRYSKVNGVSHYSLLDSKVKAYFASRSYHTTVPRADGARYHGIYMVRSSWDQFNFDSDSDTSGGDEHIGYDSNYVNTYFMMSGNTIPNMTLTHPISGSNKSPSYAQYGKETQCKYKNKNNNNGQESSYITQQLGLCHIHEHLREMWLKIDKKEMKLEVAKKEMRAELAKLFKEGEDFLNLLNKYGKLIDIKVEDLESELLSNIALLSSPIDKFVLVVANPLKRSGKDNELLRPNIMTFDTRDSHITPEIIALNYTGRGGKAILCKINESGNIKCDSNPYIVNKGVYCESAPPGDSTFSNEWDTDTNKLVKTRENYEPTEEANHNGTYGKITNHILPSDAVKNAYFLGSVDLSYDPSLKNSPDELLVFSQEGSTIYTSHGPRTIRDGGEYLEGVIVNSQTLEPIRPNTEDDPYWGGFLKISKKSVEYMHVRQKTVDFLRLNSAEINIEEIANVLRIFRQFYLYLMPNRDKKVEKMLKALIKDNVKGDTKKTIKFIKNIAFKSKKMIRTKEEFIKFIEKTVQK